MPLIKSSSNKARSQNIKTEIAAGEAKGIPKEKAIKRAVAIGYSEQRQAEGNRRNALADSLRGRR